MPGRHATERLRIAHRIALRDTIGRAQRIGSYPSGGGLIHDRHEFLPAIRLPYRLPQVVVNDLTASGLGQTAHEAILKLGCASTPTLDDPGAQLTQHVTQ